MTKQKQTSAKPAKKAMKLQDAQMDAATGGYLFGAHWPDPKVRTGGVKPAGFHGDVGEGTGI